MKIGLIGRRILVRKIKEEEARAGKIILQNNESRFCKGIVVEIGFTSHLEKPEMPPLEKGSQVIFSKSLGSMLDLTGEQLWILNVDDLIGKVLDA